MSLTSLCRNLARLCISNNAGFLACEHSISKLAGRTSSITTRYLNSTILPAVNIKAFATESDSQKNCVLGSTSSMRQCSTSKAGSLSWTTYEDGEFIYKPKHRPLSAKWRYRGLENKYTIRPLGFVRTSGRNHLGKVTITGRGGGHKRNYRMIDFHRTPPADGSVKEERVLRIGYDPNRSARIAIVAGGNRKRYILATANMKEGDIVKTSCEIGRMTVMANEGDAYPLAALAIGTLVHSVEPFPGAGGMYGRSAGTSLTLVRKDGGQAILKMPSKRQMSVSDKCMATVGRVSNENHKNRVIGKAGRNRWLGWRPASGWWQRKGGWAGRKIRPIPPMKIFIDSKASNKTL